MYKFTVEKKTVFHIFIDGEMQYFNMTLEELTEFAKSHTQHATDKDYVRHCTRS
jgi:hypothetical protein